MAKAGTGKDLLSAKERKQSAEEGVVPGSELPGIILEGVRVGDDPFPGPPGPGPSKTRVKLDENSQEKVAKRGTVVTKPTPSGGFSVAFEKIGPNEKRAKYDRDNRTIYINLEHPRIAVEVSNSKSRSPVDDPNFLRMAYEIAFTEYAIVLAQELSNAQYYFDPQDALVELRQTLDDLSKAFASVCMTPGVTR
jgi:hypothetical protein